MALTFIAGKALMPDLSLIQKVLSDQHKPNTTFEIKL